MTAIGEALARASEDDAASLEALCRALLRGGHGPDVARVLALVEGEIEMRMHAALALEELQKKRQARERSEVETYSRLALERWNRESRERREAMDAYDQRRADERKASGRYEMRRKNPEWKRPL